MDEFGYGQQGGGGGGGGKAASAASSSASAINFGSGGIVNSDAGPTPLGFIIIGAISLIAFLGVIVLARK